MALFDVDHFAGAPARGEQVGLSREKSRNLKDVYHLRRDRSLIGLVDVRQHRHAESALYALQHDQSILQSGPRKLALADRFALS